MAIKVAINGFGRIGRLAYRLMHDDENFEVVALNDLSNANELAYLLKYDSAQGRFDRDIKVDGDKLIVDGKTSMIYAERDPENLPWKELGVDIVLECTGIFLSEEGAGKHIKAGAKKVLLSAPGKSEGIKMIVYGVNEDSLDGTEAIVSAASCTTNCLAPMVKVLDDTFGVEHGIMTTVHAYTNNQSVLDMAIGKYQTRRGRAAAANIIPTSTGAAKAVGKVLPHLNGKLTGQALRIPIITGSIVDLSVELKEKVTVESVNAAFKAASNETLLYTEDPIVSSDIIGLLGSVFDAGTTQVINNGDKQMVKVMGWYDNEMAYTGQLIKVLRHMVEISK